MGTSQYNPFQDEKPSGIRTIGYLCPACGKTVSANRDVFTLAASDAAVGCSCGETVLHTQYLSNQYRLEVPCGLCGQIHTAYCPPERMIRGATAFSCPQSGQFCCFIGSEGVVEKHLHNLELSARRDSQNEKPAAFANEVVMYEILSELRDIAARPEGIMCRCGSGRYSMRIHRAAVDLICEDCGARMRIPAAVSTDIDDLCCHMRLTIPGKPS